MASDTDRSSVLPWIVAITVTAVAFTIVGIVVGFLLGRLSATSPPTVLTATDNTTVSKQSVRSTIESPLPRVAPPGIIATLEDGILQREDTAVFVNAGRGSLTVFPQSNEPFAFGLRPAKGSIPQEAQASLALVNADAVKRFGLTPEQQDRLKQIGRMPQPTAAARQEIIKLFKEFLAADGSARPDAEKALLEAVRRDGDARAPAVDQWHRDRAAVLSDEQRKMVPPLRQW